MSEDQIIYEPGDFVRITSLKAFPHLKEQLKDYWKGLTIGVHEFNKDFWYRIKWITDDNRWLILEKPYPFHNYNNNAPIVAETKHTALLKRPGLKIGDKAILNKTLEITKDKRHGWLGCKHFIVKGAETTIVDTDFTHYWIEFKDESWIDMDGNIHPTKDKHRFAMSGQYLDIIKGVESCEQKENEGGETNNTLTGMIASKP